MRLYWSCGLKEFDIKMDHKETDEIIVKLIKQTLNVSVTSVCYEEIFGSETENN
jgi:hypothetical protein